jgi:FkbM family methyltransferase
LRINQVLATQGTEHNTMLDFELWNRFRTCVRYQRAPSWQKPLLSPKRFLANQARKRRLAKVDCGALSTTRAFHFPDFTVVDGEMVSQQIISYGVYEPELTEAFLRLIRPGDVVLDIGMHLGYYATVFAVLVGGTGEVHAFEPTPSTREIATRNTNRFPQIRVHPVAVWSSAQMVVLRDYGPQWMGFNTLTKGKLNEEPTAPKEINVSAVTLDAFRSSLSRPIALIKIDAESAEREIIRGGRELLRQDNPLLSVEVGDRTDSLESRELLEDLLTLGYTPWEFSGGHFSRHQARDRYSYDNLIFAPSRLNLDQAPNTD